MKKQLSALAIALATLPIAANKPLVSYSADNGDGTFTNPVLWADFPDPDIIRVDDTYYFVSTSMPLVPGATIMRSYDMVNWEFAANALPFIENDDKHSLLNGENRYARGQWASALQYHDGIFYLLMNTLEDGAYILTASDVEGPWTRRKLSRGYYGCGLLFDTDGRRYIACGAGAITIFEVDEDFNPIRQQEVYVGNAEDKTESLEGSRLYHIGDYYYIYNTRTADSYQYCFRSTDPMGPYEGPMIVNDAIRSKGVHQGSLVQTADGDWWSMYFRDEWVTGRIPYLVPVDWSTGWPIAVGSPNDTYKKPSIKVASDKPVPSVASTDPFRSARLGKQWQWNHVPDPTKWSLTERPGWLRMHTASVSKDNSFYYVRNMLQQRMWGDHKNPTATHATIKMDVSGMREGDRAGLSVMASKNARFGVTVDNGEKRIFLSTSRLEDRNVDGKTVKHELDMTDYIFASIEDAKEVLLRAEANVNPSVKSVKFSYSLDGGKSWNDIRNNFSMAYDLSVFMGNHWTIFNYATDELGGYVDIDWFSTEADTEFNEDDYFGEFMGIEENPAVVQLEAECDSPIQLMGSNFSVNVFATYADGSIRNVGAEASYTSSNPIAVYTDHAQIYCREEGSATISVAYTDGLGNTLTTSFDVTSTLFPLTYHHFDTEIWNPDGVNAFDEETGHLTLGNFNCAGWHYNEGVDFSQYRYLVVDAEGYDGYDPQDLQLRIFDRNNYWDKASINTYNKSKHLIYSDLTNCTTEDGRRFEPEHVYYVGLLSATWNPSLIDRHYKINKVYLTNRDDLSVESHVSSMIYDAEEPVEYYTVSGIRLKSPVPGINIVKRKDGTTEKIIVK